MHGSVPIVSRTSVTRERAQALRTIETEWAEEQQVTHSLIAGRVRRRIQLIIMDDLVTTNTSISPGSNPNWVRDAWIGVR